MKGNGRRGFDQTTRDLVGSLNRHSVLSQSIRWAKRMPMSLLIGDFLGSLFASRRTRTIDISSYGIQFCRRQSYVNAVVSWT